MEKAQIERILREIIAKRVHGVVAETIDPSQELAALGVDSLAYSWILADMEDAFDFVMRSSDIMKIKTLSMAVEYVAAHRKP